MPGVKWRRWKVGDERKRSCRLSPREDQISEIHHQRRQQRAFDQSSPSPAAPGAQLSLVRRHTRDLSETQAHDEHHKTEKQKSCGKFGENRGAERYAELNHFPARWVLPHFGKSPHGQQREKRDYRIGKN